VWHSQEVLVPVTAVDEDLVVEELLVEDLLVPPVFPPCCCKKLLLFLEDELVVDFVWEDAEEVCVVVPTW
jgi:hypothetical protein